MFFELPAPYISALLFIRRNRPSVPDNPRHRRANLGRPVVGLEGDAAFSWHLQELILRCEKKLDITYVVMNDEALGAEYHHSG